MKERPIIFNEESVRAILAGRKTQTRRVIQKLSHKYCSKIAEFDKSKTSGYDFQFRDKRLSWYDVHLPWVLERCPYGKPGDRLWVKETFWQVSRYPCMMPSGEPEPDSWLWGNKFHFAADQLPENTPNSHYPNGLRNGAISAPDPWAVWVKRSPMYMPRRVSRLTLEIVDVRVERLQDISEGGAKVEGVERLKSGRGYYDPTMSKGIVHLGHWLPTARDAYQVLWDDLNAKRGFSWESNPWVWVIEFRKV